MMAKEAGVVKSVSGGIARALNDLTGEVRQLSVGDIVYQGEKIVTEGSNSKVTITQTDGKDITLIGKDTLTLDQDSNNNETVADISALQQAILKGTDLNALEETAAGGPQAGGNGGDGVSLSSTSFAEGGHISNINANVGSIDALSLAAGGDNSFGVSGGSAVGAGAIEPALPAGSIKIPLSAYVGESTSSRLLASFYNSIPNGYHVYRHTDGRDYLTPDDPTTPSAFQHKDGWYVSNDGKLAIGQDDAKDLAVTSTAKASNYPDDGSVAKIVDPNRKAYQKLKKDKNKFKREYAEELTLLYDTLKETDKFSKDILKRYQELNGSKQRGLSKYAIDLADTVLSSKQTKLNIIKEIASVKKNALDQKTKYEAQLAKMEAEMNKAQAQQQAADLGLMGSGYLQNILEYGRKNFINTMTGDGTYEEENYINTGDGLYINEDHDEDEEILSMIEDHYEDEAELDDLISNRLQSNRSNRSAEGNKYIQYEHRKPVIKISLNEDTGEYSFFAVDQDGNVLDDFPLPSDDHKINPIRFSLDNSYGTDKRGRQYKTVLY